MNEAAFYRKLLEDIASGARRTREVRLAKSGLLFWDALREEKMRCISIKAAEDHAQRWRGKRDEPSPALDSAAYAMTAARLNGCNAGSRSKKQEELNRALDSAADAVMRRSALGKKAKNLIHPQ